jgi:hypothetical protein
MPLYGTRNKMLSLRAYARAAVGRGSGLSETACDDRGGVFARRRSRPYSTTYRWPHDLYTTTVVYRNFMLRNGLFFRCLPIHVTLLCSYCCPLAFIYFFLFKKNTRLYPSLTTGRRNRQRLFVPPTYLLAAYPPPPFHIIN